MRQRAKVLLLCLTAVASLLLVRPAVSGTPTVVDTLTHYWTYRLIEPLAIPSPILASDQFFRTPVTLQVDTLSRLVNWVRKNSSPVRDTNLHFTWWNVQPKLPVNKNVVIRNQFGQFPTVVENLEFLLAPALKNVPTAPFLPLSHYLCYRAHGPGPSGDAFLLVDEWRRDVLPVLDLQYVCAPCLKIHGGNQFPPVDTLTHFAVYEVQPQSEVFVPLVRDQFITQQFPVHQAAPEYLFVPTIKYDAPTSTRQSTWGRLKVLYR